MRQFTSGDARSCLAEGLEGVRRLRFGCIFGPVRASLGLLGPRALGVLLFAVSLGGCASDASPLGAASHATGVVRVAPKRAARTPKQPPTLRGASGAPADDFGTDGAAGAPDPALPEGGASAGETSKPPPIDDSAEGGGGSQQAVGGAPHPPPGCGKQLDGTLCGDNMDPPGADYTRYFCSAGVVLAEARCPGACDPNSNTCELSDGTGQGDDNMGLNTPIRCRACYAALCRPELTACDADPLCVAHMACFASCAYQKDCFATCRQVFAGENLFVELEACVGDQSCKELCTLP